MRGELQAGDILPPLSQTRVMMDHDELEEPQEPEEPDFDEVEIEDLVEEEVPEVIVEEVESTLDEEYGKVEEETDEETDEALDELEAEELKLLDEEVSETLLVDEVAELRAIRREELTLNVEAQAIRGDEFVCTSCFLVKRTSQLANRRKMICRDCAP